MTRLVMLPVIALFMMAGCGGGVRAGGGGGTVAVPNAPLSLQATTISSSAIDLSWVDDSTNETGFRIYRGTDPGHVATLIAALGANATSYPDTGLAVSTTYYYAVVACNSAGDSAASNVANTMTNSDGGSGGGGAEGYYASDFNDNENPISEGGRWIGGLTTGLDWTNIATVNGNAVNTMTRIPGVDIPDDSAAVLTGNWGRDQTVSAIIYSANQTGNGDSGWGSNEYESCDKEVELYLRGSISPHNIRLYEVCFSSKIFSQYAYQIIVRWNGMLGDYTILSSKTGQEYAVANGDIVMATIVGNTINVYKNGTLVNTYTDTSPDAITTGNPGIGGFSTNGCNGTAHNDDFGLKSIVVSASGGG